MHMNFFSLLSILDIAKRKGIIIHTHIIGVAYSAGSILCICDHRTMSKYSDHLLHFRDMLALIFQHLNKLSVRLKII